LIKRSGGRNRNIYHFNTAALKNLEEAFYKWRAIMNTKIFRSIGAVLAGFITVFVLSVGTDSVLEKIGLFPPANEPEAYTGWMLMLALIYRSIYSVAGFYLTARLAPDAPMRHAIILGIIGTIFAALGAMANWDRSANWYPIMLVLVTLPCAWLGGRLVEIQHNKSPMASAS
jgi:hypothetical protein